MARDMERMHFKVFGNFTNHNAATFYRRRIFYRRARLLTLSLQPLPNVTLRSLAQTIEDDEPLPPAGLTKKKRALYIFFNAESLLPRCFV